MRNRIRGTLAALAIALVAASASAQERTLKLGTEGAYPPFNNLTPDGKLEGFDIDIGNALCARMKVKCEWVTQDWDGIIPALQAGKFDAIVASMFITDERRKQVDFTERYYRTPTAYLVPKDSSIASVDPAALAGKAIGVQGAGVYANYAEKFLANSEIKSYGSVPDMLTDLENTRLDAALDDLIVLDGFLKSPAGACCKLLGTVAQDKVLGEGAGIALRKGDPLTAEFNSALKGILADGAYKAINDKYFKFDLYGSGS